MATRPRLANLCFLHLNAKNICLTRAHKGSGKKLQISESEQGKKGEYYSIKSHFLGLTFRILWPPTWAENSGSRSPMSTA
jgi:hypothetical protein